VITHTELLEILFYGPDTGCLIWLKASSNTIPGTKAGWLDQTNGYFHIQIKGKKYSQHRVVWFYMTGKWPKNQIDHKDRVRTNNRWDNLREATNSQNGVNKEIRGTHRHACGKWTAEICFNKKRIYLGLFDTEVEARAAYVNKAKELHGEFSRCA
jgi:HNH endonuclease/AP2 domain